MNNVVLIGRLVADPEMRYIAATQNAVAQLRMAVDRPFSKDKEKTSDFFTIVVFGKQAENCEKYLAKGRLVGIQGRVQNDNYTDKEGVKRYNTQIVANSVEFLDWGDKKPAGTGASPAPEYRPQENRLPEGFQALDDDDDGDIPF